MNLGKKWWANLVNWTVNWRALVLESKTQPISTMTCWWHHHVRYPNFSLPLNWHIGLFLGLFLATGASLPHRWKLCFSLPVNMISFPVYMKLIFTWFSFLWCFKSVFSALNNLILLLCTLQTSYCFLDFFYHFLDSFYRFFPLLDDWRFRFLLILILSVAQHNLNSLFSSFLIPDLQK